MTLHGPLFGAAAVDQCLTDQARVQAMLDVLAALAETQAELGMLPATAVPPIQAAARAELFHTDSIGAAAAGPGNVLIPLVAALTTRVAATDPEAARWVHWGATSQDILDTSLVLQLHRAVSELMKLLARGGDAAADLARGHAGTPMAGRTWLQHATPTTFGLKAAGWMAAIDRAHRRLTQAAAEVRVLQLGGASGTRAAFGGMGAELAGSLGTRLGLTVPALPWHAHRDRLANLACALGVAAGTLGKVGRDLVLLAQPEVAEAGPPADGAGGSSTMPQKNNPVAATVAVAASIRAPGLVATVLAAMPQEHERGAGGWQAEWETIPELVRLVGGSARAVADALASLVVDPDRMALNLERDDRVAAEAVSMVLARIVGRAEAHEVVAAACRRAARAGRGLAAELAEDPEVAGRIEPAEIRRLLGPTGYLGEAPSMVDRALQDRGEHGRA